MNTSEDNRIAPSDIEFSLETVNALLSLRTLAHHHLLRNETESFEYLLTKWESGYNARHLNRPAIVRYLALGVRKLQHAIEHEADYTRLLKVMKSITDMYNFQNDDIKLYMNAFIAYKNLVLKSTK